MPGQRKYPDPGASCERLLISVAVCHIAALFRQIVELIVIPVATDSSPLAHMEANCTCCAHCFCGLSRAASAGNFNRQLVAELSLDILYVFHLHRPVVKTSAGLHYGAMQVEHVQYIQRKFGDKLAIEVAGRCRTRETAEAMRAAGAVCFHMSQWRRICGNGYDYQFDYLTKKGGYMTYRDRDQ